MKLGSAQRPKVGETVCGDAFVVLPSGSITTVAVADGLGHGPMAAEAAHMFCEFVSVNRDKTLTEIMEGAHRKIRHTRGAAAVLLRIDEKHEQMKFTGIGNIDLQAISQNPIKPVSLPGILGKRMKKILEFDYTLSDGDLLILYSDGISSRFEAERYRRLEPEDMAKKILMEKGKQHDDATCIVIRY